MRVLHVLQHMDGGGPERRRLQLAKSLGEGFEQRIVCLYARPDFISEFESLGVGVDVVDGSGGPLDFRAAVQVAHIISAFSPDIVHGAVFEGVNLAALSSLLEDVPHLIIEETGDPTVRSWRGNAVMYCWSRLADVCVSVSPPITNYFRKTLRVPLEKIVEVPNGVESPQTFSMIQRVEFRRALGFSKEEFVVGTIGRMNEDHKRYSDILAAIRILNNADVPARGLFVGDGVDYNWVTQRIHEEGLEGTVIQVGYQRDVSRFLGVMDAFVLASRQESFGLVLAEAMFCSVPIVATNVGGIPFVVQDCGILVPPFAPKAIADALQELWKDPVLSDRYRQAGLARASAYFTTKRYVSDIRRLYSGLVR